METLSTRANTLFCSFLSCLAFFAVLNHLSAYVMFDPTPRMDVLEVEKVFPIRNTRQGDQAVFSFNMEADLSSEFHWNLKQLFVYLTASYVTSKHKRNEVTVWDKIIETVDDSVLSLSSEQVEYVLKGEDYLRDRNVTLRLKYRTMPIIGLMREKVMPLTKTFKLPGSYDHGASSR